MQYPCLLCKIMSALELFVLAEVAVPSLSYEKSYRRERCQ
jgi:hypothetical protein